MNPKPNRIVVFGGSGFVGSRLVPRLCAAGHEVRIADLTASRQYPGLSVTCDVRCYESVRRACEGMDVIYNLAAVHRDDVRPLSLYDAVNVEGARQICRAAEDAGVRRLMFTSSVAVYGLPEGETNEDSEPRPFNEYGRTKLAAEAVYRQWSAGNERNLIIIRPTVLFGEGNRGNLYNLFEQIRSGRFLMIGDGRNRKSIAYVENAAAFLQFVLRFETGEHVFNYVDNPDFDMNTLVALVRAALGRKGGGRRSVPYAAGYAAGLLFDGASRVLRRSLPISSVRIKKFCATTVFSARKAAEAGFVAPIPLRAAVERTIAAEFGSRSCAVGPPLSSLQAARRGS